MPTNTPFNYSVLASDMLKDLVHLEETSTDFTVKFMTVTGKGMCLLTSHKAVPVSHLYFMLDTGELICETINEIGVTIEHRMLMPDGMWETGHNALQRN